MGVRRLSGTRVQNPLEPMLPFLLVLEEIEIAGAQSSDQSGHPIQKTSLEQIHLHELHERARQQFRAADRSRLTPPCHPFLRRDPCIPILFSEVLREVVVSEMNEVIRNAANGAIRDDE